VGRRGGLRLGDQLPIGADDLAGAATCGPVEAFIRGTVKVILRGLFGCLGGIRVEALENVPQEGGVIIAGNHRSHMDPVLIGVLISRPLWFIATDELFTVPVLGPMSRYLRAFPIRQDAPDRRALERAERLLRAGAAVALFPEGHESLDGTLRPLQGGAVLLARRAEVPVLPVGIVGTERVVPPTEWRPRHGGGYVTVRFGRPIPPPELTGGLPGTKGVEQGRQRLRSELQRLTGGCDMMDAAAAGCFACCTVGNGSAARSKEVE
jgi:1-acyl-sn-glycerol-3-phosphate acyltransferase